MSPDAGYLQMRKRLQYFIKSIKNYHATQYSMNLIYFNIYSIEGYIEKILPRIHNKDMGICQHTGMLQSLPGNLKILSKLNVKIR